MYSKDLYRHVGGVDPTLFVLQGLKHPAPFADELKSDDRPYKRVNMEDAKRGTPREWNHNLFTFNLALPFNLSLSLSLRHIHTHMTYFPTISNIIQIKCHIYFIHNASSVPDLSFHVCEQLTDPCECMQMASLTFSTRVTPEHWCKRNVFSQTHTSLSEVRAPISISGQSSDNLLSQSVLTRSKVIECPCITSFFNWMCVYFYISN